MKIGEERNFIKVIQGRQKKLIVHILRGEGLLMEVLEDRFVGRRLRVRKRKSMLDKLKSIEGSKEVQKRFKILPT